MKQKRDRRALDAGIKLLRKSNRLPQTPLADRVQAEREQLFKAIDIVECCKCANATLVEADPSEYMAGVFDVLSDLLNTAAGELGCIADDFRKAR